ncbi:cellulose synthase-like protein G3 [Wolffia australiana]
MVAVAGEVQDPRAMNTVKVVRHVLLNRAHAITFSLALLALLYHRSTSLLTCPNTLSLFLFLTLTIADLLFAFMWTLSQAFRWRPVRRNEFPNSLSYAASRETWPGLDVFVCTADPFKEPPLSVANTVLSTMAFDYPSDRLSVYVSDDSCSPLTLFAFVEAAKFARHWIPFCRDRGLVERCPEAYFRSDGCGGAACDEIKELYQRMKERVEKTMELGRVDPGFVTSEEEQDMLNKWGAEFSRQEHPPIIQVLLDSSKHTDTSATPLPNLIYVARGKTRAYPHHFKAGALNALIRVSSAMTNGAVILTLDCDMYSNDPAAPQRALCYFLDPKIASKLAYVQFPQRFRGINKHDTYGSEYKFQYLIHPRGMDGFRGPFYVGSGCFFSRNCFEELSSPPSPIVSFSTSKPPGDSLISEAVLQRANLLADGNYENGTLWGATMGMRYGSLVEDFNSGYHMMCRGWESVVCDPEPPAFLGDVPITLNDALVQNSRWCLGAAQVAFSKYSPFVYGCRRVPVAMAMCYARYAIRLIWCVPVMIYGVLPQLALAFQVRLFPSVSEAWFFLYAYLFLAAYAQDLIEFVEGRGDLRRWWNAQRMWMIRAVTSYLFGVIQFSLEKIGFSGSGFTVTSKVMDDEQTERYEGGQFNFGSESPFFLILGSIATINLVSLVVGITGGLIWGNLQDFMLQLLISGFVVVNSWPIYEAAVLRTDKARMPATVTRSSVLITGLVFSAAYFVFSMA